MISSVEVVEKAYEISVVESGQNVDVVFRGLQGISGDRYTTISYSTIPIPNPNTTVYLTIESGLAYTVGQLTKISFDLANHFHGEVVSYNKNTGDIVVLTSKKTGSGTYSTWFVSLSTEGGSIALSDASPLALGAASSGIGDLASREDHVHPLPPNSTTSASGLMSSSDKSKLDGIQLGATQNQLDSFLLNRTNHTGTQTSSTISDFLSAVLSSLLTGLSAGSNTVIAATDTVLTAFSKLQNQISSLSNVARTGSYNDLSNKPTIPSAQVNSDWNSVSGVSQILNKPTLSAVATTGSYNDLSNKPTIPPAQVNSDWNAVSGASQILNKPTLSVVATSGSYVDLSNKPVIPTKTSDLINDSGFVTTSGPDNSIINALIFG